MRRFEKYFTIASGAAFWFLFVAFMGSCFATKARADNWVFEFEFSRIVNASALQDNRCHRALITEPTYPETPFRVFGSYPCGGSSTVYHHFLGRRCLNNLHRLSKLVLECGWRHKSHVRDGSEIYYDAIGIRGRFTF